jgi:hypothetical protein
MLVQWELEYPGMALHAPAVTWTMKNVGDETALSGSGCGEITIAQHAVPDNPHIDTTPWTNPLTLDRDVAPGTAHTMSYPVEWTGQNHGTYTAMITVGEGVTAEIYFEATPYGIAPAYG